MQRPWGRKSFQGGLRYSEPGADGTRQSWRCIVSQVQMGQDKAGDVDRARLPRDL